MVEGERWLGCGEGGWYRLCGVVGRWLLEERSRSGSLGGGRTVLLFVEVLDCYCHLT